MSIRAGAARWHDPAARSPRLVGSRATLHRRSGVAQSLACLCPRQPVPQLVSWTTITDAAAKNGDGLSGHGFPTTARPADLMGPAGDPTGARASDPPKTAEAFERTTDARDPGPSLVLTGT